MVRHVNEDSSTREYGPALNGEEDVSEENIAVALPTGPAPVRPPPILQDIAEDAYNLGIGLTGSPPRSAGGEPVYGLGDALNLRVL